MDWCALVPFRKHDTHGPRFSPLQFKTVLGLRVLPHLVHKRGSAGDSALVKAAASLTNEAILQELKKEAENTPSLNSNSQYPAIVENPLKELHVGELVRAAVESRKMWWCGESDFLCGEFKSRSRQGEA